MLYLVNLFTKVLLNNQHCGEHLYIKQLSVFDLFFSLGINSQELSIWIH